MSSRKKEAAAIFTSFALGAGAMYFMDRGRGRRRRALVKDKVIHLGKETGEAWRKSMRDLEQRSEGTMARLEQALSCEPAVDRVIEQRVRAALGHVVSHPGALLVTSTAGSVVLSGWILANEIDRAMDVAERVRGVTGVRSLLRVPQHPEHTAALQGGMPRTGMRFELLQQRWSPAARLIVGVTGALAALYGLFRRDALGTVVAGAGGAALARAFFNRNLGELAGVSRERAGFWIEKTMRIDAPVSELYDFWADPRNYPKALEHVRTVEKVSDDVYRWTVQGPAGTRATWDGSIVAAIPNELIAWKSLPGSTIGNEGVARFDPNYDGSTRLHIRLKYEPPIGMLGHMLAHALGSDPKQVLDEDLVRLKSLYEQGKTHVHHRVVTKAEVAPQSPKTQTA